MCDLIALRNTDSPRSPATGRGDQALHQDSMRSQDVFEPMRDQLGERFVNRTRVLQFKDVAGGCGNVSSFEDGRRLLKGQTVVASSRVRVFPSMARLSRMVRTRFERRSVGKGRGDWSPSWRPSRRSTRPMHWRVSSPISNGERTD